jgi:hypothetical protein
MDQQTDKFGQAAMTLALTLVQYTNPDDDDDMFTKGATIDAIAIDLSITRDEARSWIADFAARGCLEIIDADRGVYRLLIPNDKLQS